MLGIQLGIGSFVAYRGVSPDLLLLVVVFISLNASREEAMLGSFLLGGMQDLITLQPMGLFAFSYGIVSMIVCSASEMVRRTHPLAAYRSHIGRWLRYGNAPHRSRLFSADLSISRVRQQRHRSSRDAGLRRLHNSALPRDHWVASTVP